jgi:hypothetical protein
MKVDIKQTETINIPTMENDHSNGNALVFKTNEMDEH